MDEGPIAPPRKVSYPIIYILYIEFCILKARVYLLQYIFYKINYSFVIIPSAAFLYFYFSIILL